MFVTFQALKSPFKTTYIVTLRVMYNTCSRNISVLWTFRLTAYIIVRKCWILFCFLNAKELKKTRVRTSMFVYNRPLVWKKRPRQTNKTKQTTTKIAMTAALFLLLLTCALDSVTGRCLDYLSYFVLSLSLSNFIPSLGVKRPDQSFLVSTRKDNCTAHKIYVVRISLNNCHLVTDPLHGRSYAYFMIL